MSSDNRLPSCELGEAWIKQEWREYDAANGGYILTDTAGNMSRRFPVAQEEFSSYPEDTLVHVFVWANGTLQAYADSRSDIVSIMRERNLTMYTAH